MVDRGECLETTPWRELEFDGNFYIVKSCFFPDQGYEFIISDLDRVWHESCTELGVSTRFKELNPSYEVPQARIIQLIQENLQIITEKQNRPSENSSSSSQGRTCQCSQKLEEGGRLVITQESTLAGLVIKWKFCCQPVSGDVRKEHLVVPLMIMVAQLQRRQQHLYSLLERKDREIEEYKSTGAKLSRRSLLTKPFDSEEFDKAMHLSKGFEREVESGGRNALTPEGQQLYRSIVTARIRLRGQEGGEGGGEANSLSPVKSSLSSLISSPGKSPVKSLPTSQEPNPQQEVEETNLELVRRQQLAEQRQNKPSKKKKKKMF